MPRDDARRVVGELRAHASRVVPDDHPALCRVRDVLQEMPTQPGGGAQHDGAVHPVGPASEQPAEPRRAELEHSTKAVPQLDRLTCLEQALQLEAGGRLGVVLDPREDLRAQRVVHVGHRRLVPERSEFLPPW